ncbi:MAG: YebC/PmpR family DNA-binding transcriptional regulator [Candidatus Portnoybacteria bacterium CG10_big_fil_rev_8_21_14_0_10_44_7]|uniref:Probable transcriptional regulatory protein COU85_01095 n=1 Tax=Candidatus Portnoybacteria bacterium CG10_big_fil_rev_8_21_14_0_10_44_7 TaxID=1974816 RepID=A0A2M8KJ30_9BACT|nr:MAG: YebC/PmpR family DNA-binding transcriptional regulator [Candidatus Portnoybacteria bacterium CG10_big_fil_rev_8_21_14_0_10_44_7]
MSGHNKWSQIKHKKAATDAKKSHIFSKLAKQITLAAKEGGGDPASNAALRMLVDKAKSANMPVQNVEKAIGRGTGEIAGAEIKPFLYEAYGPGGVAFLIEGSTDNSNRTTAEIKHLLGKLGAKWAEAGSVLYLFDQRGIIDLALGNKQTSESLELGIIDLGADDLQQTGEETLRVITTPVMLDIVLDGLKEQEQKIIDSCLGYLPKVEVALPAEKDQHKIKQLSEQLQAHNDVCAVFTNAKLD